MEEATDQSSENLGSKMKEKKKQPLKKRVRKRMLKSADIEALIEQVKLRPILWNDQLPMRSHPGILKLAWEEVATAMQQNAQACKSTWSSLRASLRYRQKIDVQDWEHGEALSFLVDRKELADAQQPQAATTEVANTSNSFDGSRSQMVMIAVAGCIIHQYNLNEQPKEQCQKADAQPANVANKDPFENVDFSLLLSLASPNPS